jgi:hypothetical protein
MDKVYREVKTGRYFHDECFDEGETRDGFEEVPPDKIPEEGECYSCEADLIEDEDDEDDDEEEDDEE